MRARTLMYHDVTGVGNGSAVPAPDVYAVTEKRFREHLDLIGERAGRPAERVEGLIDTGGWMLTFDDGGACSAWVGAELAQRGWIGHFFIVTDLVGSPGFADWDAIEALLEQGHVIGSHTRTHPARISACGWDEILAEWSDSVAVLSKATGRQVTTGSVPGGFYSHRVGRAAAAAGLTALFTSEPIQRVRQVEGEPLLIGRYAVRAGTTAGRAAAVAVGERSPWATQRAAWEARRVAKKMAGANYEKLRGTLLARRREA